MTISVLVTGGAGYIGSHTAKSLASAGFRPIVYDNLSVGHRWAVNWGPLIVADLEDTNSLKHAIKKHNIAAAIHFAGHAYVGESVDAPRQYFENNVANSLKLIHRLLDAGIKCILFSSSCAVYGVPDSIPISEGHSNSPVNPYGESKLFVERVLDWYGRAYGLRWAALRYFNAAGADPEGELGEMHLPETHLIPRVIAAAMGKLEYVEIYGADYQTRDGTAVRDFVHVSDLAEGHVAALKYLMSGGGSFVANLGTGRGFSIREIVTAVESISRTKITTRVGPRRPGDPDQLVASTDIARKLLCWSPRLSSLDMMVQTAWKWHNSKFCQL